MNSNLSTLSAKRVIKHKLTNSQISKIIRLLTLASANGTLPKMPTSSVIVGFIKSKTDIEITTRQAIDFCADLEIELLRDVRKSAAPVSIKEMSGSRQLNMLISCVNKMAIALETLASDVGSSLGSNEDWRLMRRRLSMLASHKAMDDVEKIGTGE